ncbi:MAG: protein kinase [Gammaproteobacteria bacterium]
MQARRRPAESELVVTDSPVACGADVGGWQLRERLGRGGSACVWRAVDGEGRVAALKIPNTHAADSLRYEHSLLAALRHANIVATFGVVSFRAHTALVLEYLPGGDLVALAGAPPQHWLLPLRGVYAALRELHAHGYAHCDVKARNVLFAVDDSPRLIDFAAARPLDAPLRRGIATAACTPAGASTPSQSADCFAFAALVYELATGRLPYGPTGARWQGEVPGAIQLAAQSPLLGLAADVLRASGRVHEGLSVFADDIESAFKACC